jgi:hypothetical protein
VSPLPGRARSRQGRLPDHLRITLEPEGLGFLEERLRGSITYRHYRAPGRRSNWRKQATVGAIAISSRRLVVVTGRQKFIDVPRDHRLWQAVEITADRPERVCFAFDAEAFSAERSGRVEVRLRTKQARQVVQLLGRAV